MDTGEEPGGGLLRGGERAAEAGDASHPPLLVDVHRTKGRASGHLPQHHRRRGAARQVGGERGARIEIGEHVAVDEEEGRAAIEERPRGDERAAGAEDLGLEGEVHAAGRAARRRRAPLRPRSAAGGGR